FVALCVAVGNGCSSKDEAAPIGDASVGPDSAGMDPRSQQASFVCAQIRAQPQFVYETFFADSFRTNMPYQAVRRVFISLYETGQACVHVTPGAMLSDLEGQSFTLTTSEQATITISLQVDSSGDHKITSLLVRSVVLAVDHWEDLVKI